MNFQQNRHEICKISAIILLEFCEKNHQNLRRKFAALLRSERCKGMCRSCQELSNEYLLTIWLQKLASIQPRTSHSIFIILAASRDLNFTERSSPSVLTLKTPWVHQLRVGPDLGCIDANRCEICRFFSIHSLHRRFVWTRLVPGDNRRSFHIFSDLPRTRLPPHSSSNSLRFTHLCTAPISAF